MEGSHDRLPAWPMVSVHRFSVMKELRLLHFVNNLQEVGWMGSYCLQIRCYNVDINTSSYYIIKWCADASHGRFTPTYYTKRLRYASQGRAFIQPIIFFLYMRIRKVTLVNASMSIKYVIVVDAKVIAMWHVVLLAHEHTNEIMRWWAFLIIIPTTRAPVTVM